MAKTITIKDITDGMVLAEPIVNNFGQVLLNDGTALKESHKKMLKLWNIHNVKITGDDQDDEEEYNLNPEALKIASQSLRKRMNWVPKNKYEKDLVQMGIIYLAKTGTNKNQ